MLYVPQANWPRPGSVMTIGHDKFSKESEIPDNILGTGTKVKVIGTKEILKSPNCDPKCNRITVTTVLRADGKKEAYFTTNLKKG